MTTNKARRLISALTLPLLLLAVGCDSGNGMVDSGLPEATSDVPEATPEAFTINSSQVAVSPTTSEGTFKGFGAIDDHGASKEVLDSAEPLHKLTSLSGKKILEGQKGTITIEFHVRLSPTSPTNHYVNIIAANGGFGIVEGTGAYTGLQGGGEIDLRLARNASAAAITEVLEGEARYAQ